LLISNRAFRRAIIFYTANKAIYGDQVAKELLEEAVQGIEVIIEELDKDITYKPARILGVKMSPQLLGSVATFCFGLLFSMG